jgi:hypothetical protein
LKIKQEKELQAAMRRKVLKRRVLSMNNVIMAFSARGLKNNADSDSSDRSKSK